MIVEVFARCDTYERPIVVIIPSYNNERYCRQNLTSVFNQHYSNYRIIYIDDCSTDTTYQSVSRHITACNQTHRTLLLHNKQRRGTLANCYKAVWLCQDNEIIVQLDGDDYFAHDDVLQRINKAYDNPNVWLTYGQYATDPEDFPSRKSLAMPSFVIKAHGYREYPWITSAPRTFYAWLFKEIRLESLLHQSTFFTTTSDLAYMFPMLEMAAGHICFIPDILYIYNCITPNNDHKIHLQAQLHAEYIIRAQKKYMPLHTKASPSVSSDSLNASAVSCLIVAGHDPHNLAILLYSLQKYVRNLHSCTVLVHESYALKYNALSTQYPGVKFIYALSTHYKQAFIQILESSPTPYTMLTLDTYYITRSFDARLCATMLQQTKAHGFYLSLGADYCCNPLLHYEQKMSPNVSLDNNVNAWQFCTGEYAWREPNSLRMVMYPTHYIHEKIAEGHFDSIANLQAFWRQVPVDQQSVGLFFTHSTAQSTSL